MRNNLSLKELKQIIPIIKTNNILDDEVFDYFRIAGLNNIKYEKYAKNTLFFFSYCKKENLDGWYIKEFDYRNKTESIVANNPNFTFVIEKQQLPLIKNKAIKYILVDNINDAVDKLFNYYLEKRKAKTIAITGSVGKTTCIGLLENVLKQKYNILRIYSKRVTPIILKANIINFLTKDIDYIVMEFSIYYHNHVEIFTDYLKPFIVGILNIDSSHLGVEKLYTIDDICIYKSKIFKYAQYGLINQDDYYLNQLIYKNGSLSYNENAITDNKILKLDQLKLSDVIIENNMFIIDHIKWNPFILSNLAKVQYYMVYKIAKLLDVSNEKIEENFNNYLPVEHRIHKENAFGKKIIFDGDITTYERMKKLSDNYYRNKYLVLRKVGSSENTLRISNIKEFFKKYKNVFIFDDVEYLKHLQDEENVIVVNNHDFMKNLEGTIIYHYSGYYRVFKDFSEENLNIYDKETYKIIVEE